MEGEVKRINESFFLGSGMQNQNNVFTTFTLSNLYLKKSVIK